MMNNNETNNNENIKPTHNTNDPKLIELSPTQGQEGNVITVVVQALPHQIFARLAFNSLMVDTKQMQAQGITSLVATVPPFQQTHSSTSNVPISICFLDNDMVTETWVVSDFSYNKTDKDEKKLFTPFHVSNTANTYQPKGI
jgi:hypothetical protein